LDEDEVLADGTAAVGVEPVASDDEPPFPHPASSATAAPATSHVNALTLYSSSEPGRIITQTACICRRSGQRTLALDVVVINGVSCANMRRSATPRLASGLSTNVVSDGSHRER
jgi:hypothetical protein